MDATINVLQQDRKQVDTKCRICIATNPDHADHPLSICPILEDHQCLKSAYINARSTTKQTIAAQQAATSKAI